MSTNSFVLKLINFIHLSLHTKEVAKNSYMMSRMWLGDWWQQHWHCIVRLLLYEKIVNSAESEFTLGGVVYSMECRRYFWFRANKHTSDHWTVKPFTLRDLAMVCRISWRRCMETASTADDCDRTHRPIVASLGCSNGSYLWIEVPRLASRHREWLASDQPLSQSQTNRTMMTRAAEGRCATWTAKFH